MGINASRFLFQSNNDAVNEVEAGGLHATILDNLAAAVFVCDMETHEILFLNRHARILFGNVGGQQCWRALQNGQNGPCSFCTNSKLVNADGSLGKPFVWKFQNTVNHRWYKLFDQAISWPGNRIVRLEIAFDITDQEQSRADILDEDITERQRLANELAETNIALRVLLCQSAIVKQELEEKVQANIRELISPYLENLAVRLKDSREKRYLAVISENLRQITTAFSRNLSTNQVKLTPRELQIADLIRQGKTNKEIAEILILSTRTVETYRDKLRRKLGLHNKKVNLQSFLNTIS
ncbi:MAG: hypothetical protein A2521_07920 [Deltaproteobacteria bacterium RIFOXYD12_FULL_57_12]|nr:MAG: hypothetical protein A2521_07920 [Deltaproteobacteria bacterium RIFOXYD12_FULL_57_12]